MAYAFSSETGSATPIRPLLSVNPHSDCVRSSSCVHCLVHVTPSACLLIRLADSAPLVARHDSAPPSHALLARPCSRPPSPTVRSPYSPHITPDRHRIGAFPFAAKSTCPSHPKTIGPRSSIAPSHRPTSKTQDTAALRSTRRASPLAIEAWTSSRFRRMAAVYGFVQVKCTLLLFLFCFRRSALHSLAFPIRLRPCY